MLSTIEYVEWKVEFQTIKILFESDHYHRHSGNERHFKTDHEGITSSCRDNKSKKEIMKTQSLTYGYMVALYGITVC